MLPRLPGLPSSSRPKVAAASSGLTSFYQQTLTWRDCGGGFRCTTLRVPLDYRRPKGDKIGIAIIRKPAEDPSRRLSSLLINPGGPGASGIDLARAAAQVLDAPLLSQYDVVSFDPRGVGQSAPMTCLDDAQTDALVAADPDPPTQAEQDQGVAE